MRWMRLRTGERGYTCRVLVHRGVEVGRVEGFGYGYYGTVFGKRTGNIGRDPRRARRIVVNLVRADNSGLAQFLRSI